MLFEMREVLPYDVAKIDLPERLPGIGPATMTLLRSHSVSCVREVLKAVSSDQSIPGLGPAKWAVLKEWALQEQARALSEWLSQVPYETRDQTMDRCLATIDSHDPKSDSYLPSEIDFGYYTWLHHWRGGLKSAPQERLVAGDLSEEQAQVLLRKFQEIAGKIEQYRMDLRARERKKDLMLKLMKILLLYTPLVLIIGFLLYVIVTGATISTLFK